MGKTSRSKISSLRFPVRSITWPLAVEETAPAKIRKATLMAFSPGILSNYQEIERRNLASLPLCRGTAAASDRRRYAGIGRRDPLGGGKDGWATQALLARTAPLPLSRRPDDDPSGSGELAGDLFARGRESFSGSGRIQPVPDYRRHRLGGGGRDDRGPADHPPGAFNEPARAHVIQRRRDRPCNSRC